jgi:hypothetical protein
VNVVSDGGSVTGAVVCKGIRIGQVKTALWMQLK